LTGGGLAVEVELVHDIGELVLELEELELEELELEELELEELELEELELVAEVLLGWASLRR